MKYLSPMIKGKIKKRTELLTKITLSIFVVFIFSYSGYSVAYANKIYPNVYVAGEKLGGLTKQAALDKLKSHIKAQSPQKIEFVYDKKSWEIDPSSIDLKYEAEKTTEEIWTLGRRPSFFDSFKEHLLALLRPQKFKVKISYNQEKFDQEVGKITKEIEIPMQVFSFYLDKNEIKSKPGKEGLLVEKDKLKKDFVQNLGHFENQIIIEAPKALPKVTGEPEQIQEARDKFEKMISSSLFFTFEGQKYQTDPLEIQKWANFVEVPLSPLYYRLDLTLNEKKVQSFIKDLAKKINKESKDARLTIADGRAIVFQAEEEGFKLDEQNTIDQIKETIFERRSRSIALKVKITQPKVRTSTINDLGIKELVAEGTSSFKGSPKNRISNITIGANLFNGVMIPPDGTFSFNQILGEVSASKGYLPELVIKEDRLIPETGGGLCQVSTTMFRAAVNAGLDITERTAHSFRVRYYEPPVGLDATVYQPKPDLKFKNDTPGYILIQTKIEGATLKFQFYGTKDGRTVEIKGPYTSGYRSPGGAIYIDDPSLPAGEVKQIERAIPGLTATINWTVYKDGKVLHQKTFVSKYVAWNAKYKRGTGTPPPPPEPPPPETPPGG